LSPAFRRRFVIRKSTSSYHLSPITLLPITYYPIISYLCYTLTLLMINKLTLILFIILCLEAGLALTLLPWLSFGNFNDWGNNYLLGYLSQSVNLPALQRFIASGWVRGAVTALGLLNLFIAFWEIAHFNQSLQYLDGKDNQPNKTASNG